MTAALECCWYVRTAVSMEVRNASKCLQDRVHVGVYTSFFKGIFNSRTCSTAGIVAVRLSVAARTCVDSQV